MSLALALTAALLLQAGPQPSAVADARRDDPLLGAILRPEEPATDLRAMYLKVRTEPRDAGWASSAEAALRAGYSRLPDIGPAAKAFRVICTSSLCEVTGPLDAKPASQVQSIQSPAIESAARAVGLTRVSNVFGPALDNPKQSIFATYWKRTPG